MPHLHSSLGCEILGKPLELQYQVILAMTTNHSVIKSPPLVALRKPKRITITIPQVVYERLEQLSAEDGRSLSNLAAFLLERGIGKEI
jgi:hypothetical protein